MTEPTITLTLSYFEHLLNCLANQKFIKDVNADGLSLGMTTVKNIQAQNQRVIDNAWNKGMRMLTDASPVEEPIGDRT